jgi:16S rRNA U516 pseudouridylate synthase RsuA-like enzyme
LKARIHKILADHGIGSRRGIEKLITQKKVTVNGTLASIGQFVSERDIFEIDGKTIKLSKKDPTKKESSCTTRKWERYRHGMILIIKKLFLIPYPD